MAATQPAVLYRFPDPPDPNAVEWDGTPIGLHNTITRTKSRTKVHDKTIDDTPGKREALLNSAVKWIVDNPGKTRYHDVVVHGIRVRAYTNSEHLFDYWRDNWFSPEEWQQATGKPAPTQPQVTVFAFGGVTWEPEAAYYSRATNTIIFFNTSYYGQLKSWVLGAVGRVLAEEYGIHSLHAAVVEKDGKGILYIAPTGTGKSTSSYGLTRYPNTRFHSDDWVYTRYLYHTRDGRLFSPRQIIAEDGSVIRGYRCFRWLEQHGQTPATIVGLTPDNDEIQLSTHEIDFGRGVEAHAYISEKIFYLRSNLVENFPEAAIDIVNTKLENVPDVTPEFLEEHRELLDEVTRQILESPNARTREYFGRMDPAELRQLVGRLFAFDNARAMLNIAHVFEPGRVFTNPLESVRVTDVFLLKRDFTDRTVLEKLSLDRFMERLLVGETPMQTREIAYNAYRAVDDAAERRFMDELIAEAERTGQPLYQLFLARRDVPETLVEEFELFRVLYQAANCYDLNTILQSDPRVRDKMEAVALTMELISTAAAKRPAQARCTVDDYREFINR